MGIGKPSSQRVCQAWGKISQFFSVTLYCLALSLYCLLPHLCWLKPLHWLKLAIVSGFQTDLGVPKAQKTMPPKAPKSTPSVCRSLGTSASSSCHVMANLFGYPKQNLGHLCRNCVIIILITHRNHKVIRLKSIYSNMGFYRYKKMIGL